MQPKFDNMQPNCVPFDSYKGLSKVEPFEKGRV